MNRYNLSKEIKQKYEPIIQKFLNKMEKLTYDEIEKMNKKDFTLSLSDTELNPYTLGKLLEEFGYKEDDVDHNGWQMDFWITMIRSEVSFPSFCEKLCIQGCGITFELNLVVSEFM